MHETDLIKFRSWCKNKAKRSSGTTEMYISYLTHTDDVNLSMKYEVVFKILQARINTNPQRYAHILYLKYLKDTTSNFDHKKLANMLILDIKDMTVCSNKSSIISQDELRYKVLTKAEVATIYHYVENELIMGRSSRGNLIKFTPIDKFQNLLLVRMLYESAGRANEVRQYSWDIIDIKNKKIDVSKKLTKRNKARTAEMSETTAKLLNMYRFMLESKLSKIDNKLFYNYKTYSKLLKFVKNTSSAAIGKTATPHWFRHSFLTHKAVDALKAGENMSVIKEKLRDYVKHSTTTTTEIYIKLALEFKQARILEQYGEVP